MCYSSVSDSFDLLIEWYLYLRINAIYTVFAMFVKLNITESKWSKINNTLPFFNTSKCYYAFLLCLNINFIKTMFPPWLAISVIKAVFQFSEMVFTFKSPKEGAQIFSPSFTWQFLLDTIPLHL